MRWTDVLATRADPGGGVFVPITRRCPLHCAHCSTNSSLASESAEEHRFHSFVDSFTAASSPGVVWFTGGEPYLRPNLLEQLAKKCHDVGATTVVTTGLYFGRKGRIPASLWPALRCIDFITVSIDRWHESEVPRESSFQAIQRLLDDGLSVGLQVTIESPEDPYLGELVEAVEQRFQHSVGVFVAILKPAGRGASLVGRPNSPQRGERHGPVPQACGGLSWPVFGFTDRQANACCNQLAIDLKASHLSLPGTWPDLVARITHDPVLRVIQTLGPRVLADEIDDGISAANDHCGTCLSLRDRSELHEAADRILHRPSWEIAEVMASEMRPVSTDPTLGHHEYRKYLEWGAHD